MPTQEHDGYGQVGHNQLSFLPADHTTISEHPVIKNLLPDIEAAFIVDEEVQQRAHAINASISRQVRLRIRQFDAEGYDLTKAAAALFIEQNDEADERVFCHTLLRGYFDKSIINKAGSDKVLAHNVGFVVERIKALEKGAATVLPEVKTFVDGDSVFGFSMLKVLAAPIREGRKDDERDPVEGMALLATLEHYSPRLPGTSLVSDVLFRLEDGQFDGSLAVEFLHDTQSNPDDPANQSRLLAFERMVGLLVVGGLTHENALKVVSSPNGVVQWPRRLATALAAERAKYRENVMAKLAIRRRHLEESQALLPTNAADSFALAMATQIRRMQLIQGRANNTDLGPPLTRAEAMAELAIIRRKGRGFQGNTNSSQSKNVEQSAILREVPRELRFINSQGEFYAPVQGEVPDCVKDYVVKHAGGDSTMLEKLHGFFETLQLVDLSRGVVSGLAPHNNNFMVNGNNIGTLWQIRPDKITGVDGLGKHTSKLRIFCTLEDDVVGIFKVLNKKEVLPFKRAHGIMGSTRGAK